MRLRVLLGIAVVLAVIAFQFRVPVHWQATYANTSFSTMADCLAAESAGNFTVVPHLRPHLHFARVTLYRPGTTNFVGEFEVQQAGTAAIVTWRDVEGMPASDQPLDRQTRNRADGCAKGV
jgi:hypothetical protein